MVEIHPQQEIRNTVDIRLHTMRAHIIRGHRHVVTRGHVACVKAAGDIGIVLAIPRLTIGGDLHAAVDLGFDQIGRASRVGGAGRGAALHEAAADGGLAVGFSANDSGDEATGGVSCEGSKFKA